MADTTQQQAVSQKAADDARKAADEARKAAVKGVDDRLKVKEQQVKENHERDSNLQPTPTQRENDLARVGALDHDDKEDDGSEWEADSVRRQLEGKVPGNNPYQTRDLGDDDTGKTGTKKK